MLIIYFCMQVHYLSSSHSLTTRFPVPSPDSENGKLSVRYSVTISIDLLALSNSYIKLINIASW